MLKAERVKNKMGLGKAAKVKFDNVSVRERAYKDSSGFFVGLDGPDKVDSIETVSDETSPRPTSGMSTARTEVPDEENVEEIDDEQEGDLPGTITTYQHKNYN